MVSISLEAAALDGLRRAVDRTARAGLARAMRAEGFRLARAMKAHLRAGVGPDRAPLSRRQSPGTGPRALAKLAPLVAYELGRDGPAGWAVRVGPGAAGRRRARPIPRALIEQTVAGGAVEIDAAAQARIVRRLAKRRKRVPRGWVPRVGAVLTFPRRDYPAEVARDQAHRSAANVAHLYAKALRGERWARDWWKGRP